MKALPPGEPKPRGDFYARHNPKVGARGSFNVARSRFTQAYPDVPLEDPPGFAESFTEVGADPAPAPPVHAPVRSAFRDILIGIAVIAGGSTLAYFVMKGIKQRELEEQRRERALEAEFEAMRSSLAATQAPMQAAALGASPAVGYPNPAGGF